MTDPPAPTGDRTTETTSSTTEMTSSTTSNLLPAEIDAAKHTVEQAERAVDALLAKLGGAPRAEKVTISAPLEAALQRLRDARAILDRLDEEA